jgi:putative FmdB family regulatory protein
MPIYEYVCKRCKTEFEELVRMGTPDGEIECPGCGEHQAKRRLSLFSSNASRGEGFGGESSSSRAGGCGSSGFS